MKLSVGLFALFATAHAGSYTDETYYNPTCVAPYSLAWSEPMAIADMTSDDFQKNVSSAAHTGYPPNVFGAECDAIVAMRAGVDVR